MPHTHRFCIVAAARSGSEYFTTRLNEHPEIACHRELFNRNRFVTAFDEATVERLPPLQWRDSNPVAALEKVREMSGEVFPTKRMFGFKLFLNHAQPVRKHVRETADYKLIILERHNKLAQYASMLTSRKTGVWSVWADDSVEVERATVVVDLPGLEHFVALENQRYAEFGNRIKGRPDVLRIASEELDARLVEVLEFLGVNASAQLRVVRLRHNPDPLAQRVENWQEVLRWLDQRGLGEWANG